MKYYWIMALLLIIASEAYAQTGGIQTPIAFSLNETVAPASTLLNGQNQVQFQNGKYYFKYLENNMLITEYEIDPADLMVQNGLLRIRETVSNSFPVYDGGTKFIQQGVGNITPLQLANAATHTFSHQLNTSIVSFYITDTIGNPSITREKQFDFSIQGKTLIIHARALNPSTETLNNYRGFSFNCSSQTPNAQGIIIPYMEIVPLTAFGNNYFYSTYIDFTQSGSNTNPNALAFSSCGTDSIKNSYESNYIPIQANPATGQQEFIPLEEKAYVTVSQNIEDTMMYVHRNPSSYRSDLSQRIVFDMWEIYLYYPLPGNTYFEKASSLLQQLKNFGLEKLAVIFHVWQGMGYDCGFPTQYPANNGITLPTYPTSLPYGGSAGMRTLSSTAVGLDYLFGLHENYIDMYPNSTHWNTNDIALKNDGNYVNAWNNPNCTGGNEQSYQIATDKRTNYMQQEAQIASNENYTLNSSFLDVTAAKSIYSQIDYSYANTNARTSKQAYQNIKNFHQAHKTTAPHAGAHFGEGNKTVHSAENYYAGIVDGVEGETVNEENVLLIPDFEIKHMKSKMVKQGMGYFGRWITGPNYQNATAYSAIPQTTWDKIRAASIAFNHSGFMGEASIGGQLPEFYEYYITEYYTFKALQEEYLTANATEIAYYTNANGYVELEQAIFQNANFSQPRLRITYDNGLIIYVNYTSTDWFIPEAGNGGSYLPPYGFYAHNPTTNLTAQLTKVNAQGQPSSNGNAIVYVRSNEYIFMDARGNTTTIGTDYQGQPFTSTFIKAKKPNGFELIENTNNQFSSTATPLQPPFGIETLGPAATSYFNEGQTIQFNATITHTLSGQPLVAELEITYEPIANTTILNSAGLLPEGNTTAYAYTFTVPAGTPLGNYKWRIIVSNGINTTASNYQTIVVTDIPITTIPAPLCTNQLGVCANSVQPWSNGSFQTCTAANYGINYQLNETTCNDTRDNDCDGQIDCTDNSCNGNINCTAAPACGNNTCDTNETCINCSTDCGICIDPPNTTTPNPPTTNPPNPGNTNPPPAGNNPTTPPGNGNSTPTIPTPTEPTPAPAADEWNEMGIMALVIGIIALAFAAGMLGIHYIGKKSGGMKPY